VLNRELGAEFDLGAFRATWRATTRRMRGWTSVCAPLVDQSCASTPSISTSAFPRGRGDADKDFGEVHPQRLEVIYEEAGLALDGWFTDAARRLRALTAPPPASGTRAV
jgi:hypothetical protein